MHSRHSLRLPLPVLAAAALVATHVAGSQATRQPLTIERLTSQPALTGIAPSSPTWSPRSQALAFLWNESGAGARTLYVVARDGTAATRVLPASTSGAVTDFVWNATGDSLIYVQGGNIWKVASGGGAPVALTTDGGDRSDITLSPDGAFLSYLSNGDLYRIPRTGGAAVRLSSVGVPAISPVPFGTYNRPDVEIGSATWGGDAPAYAWSPDSRFIAVHFVDRRNVPIMAMPFYTGGKAIMNTVRRGAPGEVNETRKVGVIDVATRALRFVEFPDSSSTRIVNFTWSPTGVLLIDRESDDAIDRSLFVLRPENLIPRRIWRDRRETRIYNDIASSWNADGRFVLLTGDLDDRYRVYALTPGDTTLRALTPSGFDVAGAAHQNRTTRAITYVSNDPLPSERHVWQVKETGLGRIRLTNRPGTHTPFLSPDGRTLALLSTDDVTPTELYLKDATATAVERRITVSQSSDFLQTTWLRPTYVDIPAAPGLPRLHLRTITPPNLDPGKRYPVLFGPVYSNTVRNRWQGLYATLQQYLAIEKGYIIVQVDVRGSTGYGRDYREKFLMDWGGSDLDDLETAATYMKSLPYVDGSRLGIWGSSYGGTLTVYALLRKPGLFQAGVAGAAATDPNFFGSDDVAIARRPQTHPATFQRGALQYVGNLRDHLLLIHGMEDDVVPFATSVALADEFMRLGKNFDFAFAPSATHGWTQRPQYARYLLQRLVDHFDRYLGLGPR